MHSRSRPGGITLGLKNTDIWWQGYGGLGLKSLEGKLNTLIKVWDGKNPDYILLHVGANDIGKRGVFQILRQIDGLVSKIRQIFPSVCIVWSQLLPRTAWRYSENHEAMERVRKRINRYGAMAVLKNGGCYLLHPDLMSDHEQRLFADDGVHLSALGNDLFLNQIRAGFDLFLNKKATVHC